MAETPKPADCPHSWADHCPGKRACTWLRCSACKALRDRDREIPNPLFTRDPRDGESPPKTPPTAGE